MATTTTKEERAAKRAKKAMDDKITLVYNANCMNIQIPMMKIPEIFKLGTKALQAGADDEALKKVIVDFVETIRSN